MPLVEIASLLAVTLALTPPAQASPQPPRPLIAQASQLNEPPPLVVGTFNNGFRYVQIAQDNGRVCLATFFDDEGQATALNQALGQVRQEAAEAEAELEDVLQRQIGERRQGILTLLTDNELLSRTLASGQITPEQAEQIERFRNNPDALDRFLTDQLNEARQSARIEIEQRRTAIETELTETANNALNFPAFQGIASISGTALPDVYATAADDVILLPQSNGLLLLGPPSQLVSYGPIDESFEDYPDLLSSTEMQSCLSAEEPFRVDLNP